MEGYKEFSRDQLFQVIQELKTLNDVLLNERIQEDTLAFSWSGNLGHWYYNISTGFVLFNPLKVEVLGYTMDELPKEVHYKFFVEKLHPDDYGPTMAAMKRNMIGEMPMASLSLQQALFSTSQKRNLVWRT